MEKLVKLKLQKIKSKKYVKYSGLVYDLTVEDDHSFLGREGLCLHNSICKTRIQTGFGIPTLHSVADAYMVKKESFPNVAIIADGGIRYPADLAKSIAAGADAVICGGILAGTDEAPGNMIITNDGKKWKNYRGMASQEVQDEKMGGMKDGVCAEGVSHLVKYKGSVRDIMLEFAGGLRSSLTYANASTLEELRRNVKFIYVTEAGINESHAYGTKIGG